MTTISDVDGVPVIELYDEQKLPRAPVVSVAITTYNHEPWIADAIEGVLMQKTDFPFELVVAEDCSTDNTRAIVLEYQKRHPHIIRLLLPERNLGGQKNGRNLQKQCRGFYLALCEGDDYWTNPAKLQKQVDLLRANPESVLCVAMTETIDDRDGKKTPTGMFGKFHKAYLTFEDAARGYWHTSSYLFVREKYLAACQRWQAIRMYDIVMLMVLTEQSPAVFLDEVVSVYRYTGKGIFSGATSRHKIYSNIQVFEQCRRLFKKECRKPLGITLRRWYRRACALECQERRILQLFKCLWKWCYFGGLYQPCETLKDILKFPFRLGGKQSS